MWLSAITRTYSQGLYTSQNTTQMLVVIFWIMTQIQIPWDNLKAFGRHAAVKTLASQWEAPVCISCCHCITVARIVVYCGQIYYGWTGIHSEVISLRIINQSRKIMLLSCQISVSQISVCSPHSIIIITAYDILWCFFVIPGHILNELLLHWKTCTFF